MQLVVVFIIVDLFNYEAIPHNSSADTASRVRQLLNKSADNTLCIIRHFKTRLPCRAPPERIASRQAGVRYCLRHCGTYLLCAAAEAASGSGIPAYSSSECSRTHLAICNRCLTIFGSFCIADAGNAAEIPIVLKLSKPVRLIIEHDICRNVVFLGQFTRGFQACQRRIIRFRKCGAGNASLREARRPGFHRGGNSCVNCSPWKSTAGALAVR